MSILYWMRDQSGGVLPFFVHIDDMSVLPVQTLSLGPPAHLVPADLTPAIEFEPELHCCIVNVGLSAVQSHDRQAMYTSAPSLPDPGVGLGLTATLSKSDDNYLELVHQLSPISPIISSPLVPRKFRWERPDG